MLSNFTEANVTRMHATDRMKTVAHLSVNLGFGFNSDDWMDRRQSRRELHAQCPVPKEWADSSMSHALPMPGHWQENPYPGNRFHLTGFPISGFEW